MNLHVSNFREALVFANECDIDTAQLEQHADVIVAEFLIGNALAIRNYDANSDTGDGSAAFRLGLVLSGMENDFPNFPSLSAHAYRAAKEYASC
ncbi:hypothetical protein CPT_Silvanus_063 [Stenotrophomonas phage Silvanus]|nr:hypothetical protein CPT_Silvanus_063 [Stenotrophomonas phage Silvanus]